MKIRQQGNPRPAKRPAKKPTNVFHANLLNPTEVEFVTRESPLEQSEKLRGQWLLDGTVSRKMYAALVDNFPYDLVARLSVFPTPMGAAYAVITTQIGICQHRFVLPLYEPKVTDFLASVCQWPLNICLGNESDDDARTYDCALSPGLIKSVLDLGKSLDLQHTAVFISELPKVLGLLLSPNSIPGSSMTDEAEEVYVSVLMLNRAPTGHPQVEECATP
jgi:hypothetical protein